MEYSSRRAQDGYRIILTSDRTLMSEYNGCLFLGFSACIPKGLISDKLYFSLFCPSVEANKGIVKYAPCGTRKIEAALLSYGFKRDEVIVAHPDFLGEVVSPKTKVIGITENDPLGIGPATSTFTQLFGGDAYMAVKFRELLENPVIQTYKPKIIVGGPGTWQLEDEKTRRMLDIDCVVIGEAEKIVGPLFDKAISGEQLPGVVYGEVVEEEEIPVIAGPTINGIVEIARGCGRGCKFCVPTLQSYRCLPIEHIMKEVEINLRAGRRPLLHAEDVLRYKAKGLEVNKDAVVELFKTIKKHPDVESVGISHFALSSVMSSPDLIEEVSSLLDLGGRGEWFSGQTGIETGSPKLMSEHMKGKCKPFRPEDWPDIVVDAFEVLSENRWIPCATVILGLPGETIEDVELTIGLVEELKHFRSLIVPLFFVSEGGLKYKAESFQMEEMSPRHTELLFKCWEHNFNWGDTIIDENLPIKGVKKHVIKIVFSQGIKQAKKLMDICKKSYDYNLPEMIRDIKEGKINTLPTPLSTVYKILK